MSKNDQGKPRVTIYLIYVELECQMLQAMLKDHMTSGPGEEDLWKFSQYLSMAAILLIRPGPFK